MKEKKLRRKIKTSKKGIAFAAVALIMSGNLASISTPVLATENSNTVLTNNFNNRNQSYGQLYSGYPVAQSPWNGNVYYQGRDYWGESTSASYTINSWQKGNLNGNEGVVPSVPNNAIDGQILLPSDSTKPIIIRASDFEYGNDDKTGRTAAYTLNKDITNFLPNRSYTTTLSCEGFGFGSIELITTNGDKTVTTGSRSLGSFTAKTNIIPNTQSGKLSLKINSGQVEEYYSRYGEITPNITLNLTYSNEWQSVDSLFTSTDHSELAPGITSEKIQEVKQLVANISN
ncbi:MAG: hypothetical protein IC227_00970 [Enterococcus lacertideformus]|uniref:Uncharacterized protein n=1 Tax=Enterococcus lacertideformus TaxID=2771493 RepID=A0A931AXM9_9ENTE|nr:hypothetical protein [Enterococcus lacertideformus]